MGKSTGIEWADATFNPWIGCEKVSEGCKNCYAEVSTFANHKRSVGVELWGRYGTRLRTSENYWRQPLKWQDEAKKSGKRKKVFCASLADVFEMRLDSIDDKHLWLWRYDLFQLIDSTPELDWLLLTKRPQNIEILLLQIGREKLPDNVWMGVTAENQEQADKRIPILLDVPAKIHWLSAEPLLGFLYIEKYLHDSDCEYTYNFSVCDFRVCTCIEPRERHISWVIAGGESGTNARPMNPEWVRNLRDQCMDAGTSFFFKQWGEWSPVHDLRCNETGIKDKEWFTFDPDNSVCKIGKKNCGSLLDGREWKVFPELSK